jgi:hypothetical protein
MTDEPAAQAGWYPDASGQPRWWDGSHWVGVNPPKPITPGRVAGFVCGLIGIFFTTMPIVSIPLGIVGCVKSSKALRILLPGTRGRRLAVAGLTLSMITLIITAFLILVFALRLIALHSG